MKLSTNNMVYNDVTFTPSNDGCVIIAKSIITPGENLVLVTDDDVELRSYTVADYMRCVNDGFKVTLTNTPEAVPVEPTAEEIQASRVSEIKAACEKTIVYGFDADVLGRGMLHYSLTSIQQRDLDIQYKAVTDGAAGALWHDTSRVTHEVYTAEQFMNLYKIGFSFMINCKIRSDFLEEYVIGLIADGKINEAVAVNWETNLPTEYQSQVDTQVAMLLSAFGGTSTVDPPNTGSTEGETVTSPDTADESTVETPSGDTEANTTDPEQPSTETPAGGETGEGTVTETSAENGETVAEPAATS